MSILPVTPVCERSDDQSAGVPEVLVTIAKLRGDHVDMNVVRHPVVTELTQPFKVVGTEVLYISEIGHHITGCGGREGYVT